MRAPPPLGGNKLCWIKPKDPDFRRIRAGPKGRYIPSTRKEFVSICEYT